MTDILFYLIICIFILLSIITYIVVNRKRAMKNLKRSIAKRWGRIPEEQYKNEELKAISGYYSNLADSKKENRFIDNITWNDLDMDSIFKRINNTQSTVGEEFLYSLLRVPVLDEPVLKERHRLIEYFRVHPGEREKLQILLTGLGKKRFVGIYDYFFENDKNISFKGTRYILLSIGFLISPFAMILNPAFGFLCMATMFITNNFVYYKAKNELEYYLEELSYVVNLIKCSKKIVDTDISAINEYSERLKESSRKIKSLSINSFYSFFYQTNDQFFESFKATFLIELIAFERLLKIVNKHRKEIRCLYETIGFVDSMISVASYRETLDFYTVPSMYKSGTSKPPSLFFTDAYHPLINEPVTNSSSLGKPVLITGSNASGKSTFLKMTAINAVFAQTIHTCLAREYSSSYFMIFTSMALQDNLSNNESYYIAEIKSLKRIFDNLNDAIPLLCMIDEVLRGTNTIERIAASSEVLYSLSKSNCMCIAATHDIELASILKNQYDNYHFQESFDGSRILFDYKVYFGKSSTRNAIKLLSVMGYSDDIVEAAEGRAKRFAQEGKWAL